MKTITLPINILTLALTLGVTGMIAVANAQSDDFNRTVLGANWTVQTGSFDLNGATVGGDSGSLMTFGPGAGQNSASMDVILDGSTSVQYGALVLGYANEDQCAFIKIQDNGGLTGFDTAAFYYGNNGAGSGLDFFNITGFDNTQSATISASLVGTVATLTIDSGAAHAVYTFDYGSGTIFGNDVGLGVFGTARLDNFSTPAVPEPTTLALAGLSGLTLLLLRRRVQ